MNNKKYVEILPRYRFSEFRDCENWIITSLGDICYILSGVCFPIEMQGNSTGKYSFFKVSDISNAAINNAGILLKAVNCISDNELLKLKTKTIPKGSTIFAKTGEALRLNRRAITNTECLIDNNMVGIKAKFKEINDYFIFLLLQLVDLRKYCAGLLPSVQKTVIKKIKIAFTNTLAEQKKITVCLSSLDYLIYLEEKKLLSIKDYKKMLLQKLFPTNENTIPEWRFPEFRCSEEWKEKKIKDIANYRRGSFPQPYGLSKWYDELNGMPFVQVFDVDENMQLKPTTKNKISQIASKQSVFIKKGTLIVTLQGSIGRVAITQYDSYLDRTLLLFEKFYIDIDKSFFAYAIQRLFEIKKQTAPGGTIKTITVQALSEFIFKMPERAEQKKIASFLSSIDHLIDRQVDKIKILKNHKKALMQGLFPNIEYF